MDPRFSFRKGYDTDLIILRSLFALDPNTNLPISSFYTPVADGIGGINWLSLTQYFSAGTGILNFVSSVQSYSTCTGFLSNYSTQSYYSFYSQSLNAISASIITVSTQTVTAAGFGFLDTNGFSTQRTMTFSSGNMFVDNVLFYNPNTVLRSDLTSTVQGLGTAKYISSSQFFSTIDRLGPGGYGYVNTPSLVSTTVGLNTTIGTSIASTVRGLAQVGYISSSQLLSSIAGLSNAGFVTVAGLASSVGGLGTIGYISTTQLASSIQGLGTAGYISSSQLQSTIIGLGGTGLISSGQLTSSVAGLVLPQNLVSTVAGLATAGYVSTSQLTSTVAALARVGYVSTSQLASTVDGLGSAGYISTSQLVSTVIGLGGTGLISTGQLTSTTAGILNVSLGFPLASTVAGLATAGYISTSQLVSTTAGVLAAIQPASGASVANLISTVQGLGTASYVSTATLNTAIVSTTVGLQAGFFVVNANNVFVTNSRLTVSSATSIVVISTFFNSSITYQGNMGQITGSNPGGATQPLYFSSATLALDRWSSFITSNSILTLDVYPTFLFANLGIPSAGPTLIYLSSFIQGGSTYLSSQMARSAFYPTYYNANGSNVFEQPFKISVLGSAITPFYTTGTRLAHYLPNAITAGATQGFSNNNVSIYFGSTNSIFLSIQNLPVT